jgi:chromosome segregation protein
MTLLGFKSFADKTEIHFQDGVTALLGPNGCGKSNVVDAIKWVLGEQSTRNMRAENMVDVIFNGTEQRRALNVAEVSLVIANDHNLLDLDVPEIEIKRRLYRSGESEYFINNSSSKLKEVKELFLDTGVGKSAYSIMEQGKIDQILSSRPEDRRYIFEEAAGITRYKIRGAEAERKLKKTQENMSQVENILHEVKRNHDSLKKQSDKTLLYRKHKDALIDLEILLKRHQLLGLKNKKEKHQLLKDSYLNKLDKENNAVQSLSLELKQEHNQVDSMEQRRIEIQKQLYGMDIEEENRRNQIRMIQERTAEFQGEFNQYSHREQQIKDRMNELQGQVKERQLEVEGFIQRITEIDATILSLEKTIKQSEDQMSQCHNIITEKEKSIDEMEQEKDKLQEDLRILTQNIVEQLDRGLGDSGFSLTQKKRLFQNIYENIDTMNLKIQGKEQRLQDLLDLKQHSQEELPLFKSFFVELHQRLQDQREQLLQLDNLFPDFLEEFLSPSGIIQQRRENEQAMDALQTKGKKYRHDIEEQNKKIQEAQDKIEESRKLLEDYRVNRVRLSTQKAAVEDNLLSLNQDLEEQEKNRQEQLNQMAQVQKRISATQQQQQDLQNLIDQAQKLRDSHKKEIQELEKGINNSSQSLQGREKELQEKKIQVQQWMISLEREQMELQHLEEEIQQLQNDFRDQYSKDLQEMDESQLEDQGIMQIKGKITEEKIQIKQLGQVNLMAPEEYAEVKERYDFLNKQMEDLRTARENLMEVTREIRRESEERFLKTFKLVEENFKQMFRRLFGGGRAEFKLMDPDNVLESGIEVYAQPPGKKLENISLLSGGERSLTGVGLLFATYLVKPSPFCILDEMDAALDDANIQRFVHVLMDFAERSQFVVITHNKKTVIGARTLLGVTMQESGVSKVISMRLEQEE